ncbi:MAG: heterodisulfide reductase-related iron-sulfur binding cluster [Alphaproteobacteria bacterium]|nr:heterodisulfide reductase-related iron-sulfur binding cluster [Alphaproteobacteria bacterium]
MREGSLDAPVRHPLNWQDPEFYDEAKLDEELRRVFDICHGCRRCFNLCDSFPKLFDLVDEAGDEELEAVSSDKFGAVVDACTLCDLCFMTKCPYVPPHEFNLDFPHLMLRYRAVERKKGKTGGLAEQLVETDRNGKLAGLVAPLANWASDTKNGMTRGVLESVAGVHREAALPKFHGKTFAMRAKSDGITVNSAAPAAGKRKAVIYATCFVNYNNPSIGEAARRVLAHNGVETKVVYPSCCGMPQLEQGDVARVAATAAKVAAEMEAHIRDGWDIIALVPSCALMLKFEWPLLVPDNAQVKALAQATFDISEYVVDISKRHGLADGLVALDGGVTLHIACHARAQNMGQKAAEMLRLIPGATVGVIERCSGHGGSWGVMKDNFEIALKVGKPVAKQAAQANRAYIASECPLAGEHIIQGMQRLDGAAPSVSHSTHPIELFARAYGL